MNLTSFKAGKSAVEFLEEAFHLLRSSPASTLATYYAGAIPFVLGFLYFWADMSRSPFAYQHLAEAALATAGLFLWMKFFQALFARRIRAHLAFSPVPPWSFRQAARIFFCQTVIQPSGLFFIPAGLILALPFGWIYAFYQNVTALGDAGSIRAAALITKARKQAVLWPLQNHITLGATLVFAAFVFLNWLIVSLSIPSLLKMLFGFESVFSRSPVSMLNTTFFTAILGLTYLSVDPILKTVYVLRCFYGESLQSGEDLKANLKQSALAPHLVATIVILIWLASGWAAGAQSAAEPQGSTVEHISSISPAELDRQIDKVIHENKYAWRMPRAAIAGKKSEKGMISKFVGDIANLARRAFKRSLDWIESWFQDRLRSGRAGQANTSTYDWITSSFLLDLLLVGVFAALILFFLRARRQNQPVAPMRSEAIQFTADIADENLGPDQLPEDGWMALAQNLLERGEFRLSIRAFYLLSLANLAGRNLIAIARFKSNREYENELRRRAHALPDLLEVFEENVSAFEGIWYGMHDVNVEAVHRFALNVERMMGIKPLQSL